MFERVCQFAACLSVIATILVLVRRPQSRTFGVGVLIAAALALFNVYAFAAIVSPGITGQPVLGPDAAALWTDDLSPFEERTNVVEWYLFQKAALELFFVAAILRCRPLLPSRTAHDNRLGVIALSLAANLLVILLTGIFLFAAISEISIALKAIAGG